VESKGTAVQTTNIGADDAAPTKSGELYGGTLSRAPRYLLAAAERPFRQDGTLTAAATPEKRDQKKSQPTFKGSIDAGQGKSSITQFEDYVSLLQQRRQLSFELVHMAGEP